MRAHIRINCKVSCDSTDYSSFLHVGNVDAFLDTKKFQNFISTSCMRFVAIF